MTVEFRRILVPIDFSPSSRLALEHAKALVTKFGGVLGVLHVVEDRVVTVSGQPMCTQPARKSRKLSSEMPSKGLAACLTKEERDRYGATLTLLIGPPAMTIVEHAASSRADLS